MGGGKPPKEYLLKCAKKDHSPLMSYSKDKNQETTNLAEFLSHELEYSPEFIYDLLKKYQSKKCVIAEKSFAKENEGVKQ